MDRICWKCIRRHRCRTFHAKQGRVDTCFFYSPNKGESSIGMMLFCILLFFGFCIAMMWCLGGIIHWLEGGLN